MDAILNNLSQEAIAKVEKGLLNYTLPLESTLKDHQTETIKIGPTTTRRPKKRIPFRIL